MYFLSSSKKKIDISGITSDEITLEDIAHHLTKICRYGGALPLGVHYSVANHSLTLTRYARAMGMSEDVQRALLMHDASEAYLGDIVSGLKQLLPDYKEIENRVESLIRRKYKITYNWKIETHVKYLDTCIVVDEAKAFFPYHVEMFTAQLGDVTALGVEVFPDLHLDLVKKDFLGMCKLLKIEEV